MTRVAAAEDRLWLAVDDVATAGTVRRAVTALGTEAGLDATRLANAAIVGSEIATNLARHADRGSLLLRLRRDGESTGIGFVAIDHGPGMSDVAASSRDGASTAGTLGIGLGAIARLTDAYDIYSRPGAGTVLAASVWTTTVTPPAIGGLTRPIPGEEVCGDAYAARVLGGRTQLLMCDGLGHGALAERASRAVVEAFLGAPDSGPKDVLAHVSAASAHTRGSVAGIAELTAGKVRFAGIGNIGASIADNTGRRVMVSLPGIVGQQHREIREYDYPAPAGALVILHSDGITDRWSIGDHPGLVTHDPLVVAATLLRDAGHRRDDAAVLVARAP